MANNDKMKNLISEVKDLLEQMNKISEKARIICINIRIDCGKKDRNKTKAIEVIEESYEIEVCEALNQIVNKFEKHVSDVENNLSNEFKDALDGAEHLSSEMLKTKKNAQMHITNFMIINAEVEYAFQHEVEDIARVQEELTKLINKFKVNISKVKEVLGQDAK